MKLLDFKRIGRTSAVIAMLFATAVTADEPGASLANVIEAREIAFAKTMADRDPEACLTFIAPEAVFFNGNEPIRGRDAVARAWTPLFEGPDAPFSWYPDTVVVLDSGNLAHSSGPVLGAGGEQVGRFNTVWRREPDGAWLVVFDKGS
jgi:ketosteroid isomerase-like protein